MQHHLLQLQKGGHPKVIMYIKWFTVFMQEMHIERLREAELFALQRAQINWSQEVHYELGTISCAQSHLKEQKGWLGCYLCTSPEG